ncbi:MAG: hypothetical protein GY950_18830, partial [bacterium]|nr:hypothetical protein [bacterium]
MIRKIFLGMLIAFVLAPAVYGDTYVKINHHSDGYYNYGNMVPAENTQIEYWFGDKRMVCSTSRAKLILDFKRKKFRVVN